MGNLKEIANKVGHAFHDEFSRFSTKNLVDENRRIFIRNTVIVGTAVVALGLEGCDSGYNTIGNRQKTYEGNLNNPDISGHTMEDMQKTQQVNLQNTIEARKKESVKTNISAGKMTTPSLAVTGEKASLSTPIPQTVSKDILRLEENIKANIGYIVLCCMLPIGIVGGAIASLIQGNSSKIKGH